MEPLTELVLLSRSSLRFRRALALTSLLAAVGCSANDSSSNSGNGGSVARGGANSSGASSTGLGGATANGGSSTSMGGATSLGGAAHGGTTTSKGGASAAGGNSPTAGANGLGGNHAAAGANGLGGGNPTAGNTGSGGRGQGGAAAGGAHANGGTPAGGGATSSGGSTSNGGSSSNGGGQSCPFPTSLKWTSSGPLAEPRSASGRNFVSLKDFTHVFFNNQHIVYASVFDTASPAGYSSVGIVFKDWTDMAAASQVYMKNLAVGSTVAPTVFYFTPKSTWVLITQWGFSYATSTDPTDPSKWTSRKNLLTNGSANQIDPTVICDKTNCYLFYAGDDGKIYRSSMAIGNFPGTFNGYETILSDTQANLFEGVQVYTVKGTGEYLMIVEAMGSGGRFFRGFRATSLGGSWTAISGAASENTPFAGKKNVTFSGSAWTNDISHGDLIRSDPDETQPIDPCNMQFLYQGRDPSKNPPYNELPYRPGLLTRVN